MAIDGTLKHWSNGSPALPDEGLTALKYWNHGAPYTMIKAGAPPGVAPTGVFYGPFGGSLGGPI